MTEIVTEEDFLVHEQGSSIWNGSKTETHLWFEVLEGEDQGIRVSIPLHNSQYDEELRNKIHNLSDGDIVTASLKRKSKSSSWIPTEIQNQYNLKDN